MATRGLPSQVEPGTKFEVEMTASGYGLFGQVVETLPTGFSYVSSTLLPEAVTSETQEVKFTLLGDTSFSYTVTASTTVGTYEFNGILKDEDRAETPVGGSADIIVTE